MWSERITPKCRRRSVPRDKLKLADMKKMGFGRFIMAKYRRIGSSCMALSLSALALAPGPARSSACNEEIVAEIRMATGDRCWVYSGRATTFMGEFSRGQNVEVQMSGEAFEYDPATNKDVKSWQPRMPSVEGPGEFSTEAEMGSNILNFRTAASGIYRISFYPCAMWGGQGEVRICTD
jgi:hypothetical protein